MTVNAQKKQANATAGFAGKWVLGIAFNRRYLNNKDGFTGIFEGCDFKNGVIVAFLPRKKLSGFARGGAREKNQIRPRLLMTDIPRIKFDLVDDESDGSSGVFDPTMLGV
jgi:hypothetical protein